MVIIPKDLVENYDGKTVKFRISEEEIEGEIRKQG
jgi:hypothetical protein